MRARRPILLDIPPGKSIEVVVSVGGVIAAVGSAVRIGKPKRRWMVEDAPIGVTAAATHVAGMHIEDDMRPGSSRSHI